MNGILIQYLCIVMSLYEMNLMEKMYSKLILARNDGHEEPDKAFSHIPIVYYNTQFQEGKDNKMYFRTCMYRYHT